MNKTAHLHISAYSAYSSLAPPNYSNVKRSEVQPDFGTSHSEQSSFIYFSLKKTPTKIVSLIVIEIKKTVGYESFKNTVSLWAV